MVAALFAKRVWLTTQLVAVEAACPSLIASSVSWKYFDPIHSLKILVSCGYLWLLCRVVALRVTCHYPVHCDVWLTTGCCGRVKTCFAVYRIEGRV
jgi:hypothetical protein